MTNPEPVCKRCSKCCYLVIDGVISNIPCKYLVPMGNNRFVCRIYLHKNRIGMDIGHGNKCHRRTDVALNYVNCPYNQKDWGTELDRGSKVPEEIKGVFND